MSPAVAMIPVEVTPQGEIFILFGRVCDIAAKDVDKLFVFNQPCWVHVTNECTC